MAFNAPKPILSRGYLSSERNDYSYSRGGTSNHGRSEVGDILTSGAKPMDMP